MQYDFKTIYMISLTQVAAVGLRIFSTLWLVDALLVLTAFPADIYGMKNYPSGYLSGQRELDIVLQIVKLVIYLGLGTAFWFFPLRLAKLLTNGLDHDTQAKN
jgi:hypothetical protein